MLKKTILLLLLIFLGGVSNECRADKTPQPVKIGSAYITVRKDNTFSHPNMQGRIMCSAKEMDAVYGISDHDQRIIAFLKCAEVQEITNEDFSFTGGFHYPHITKKSQIRIKMNIEQQVNTQEPLFSLPTRLTENLPAEMTEELRQYLLLREVILDIDLNWESTLSFVNEQNKTIGFIKTKDIDVETIIQAGLAAVIGNESDFNKLFFKAVKNAKIIQANYLTVGDKPNVSFEGTFQPLAFYATDGSSLKFYNQDEKTVISVLQHNAKTSVDLRYPMSGKKMLSFTIDTSTSFFSDLAKSLDTLQTEKEYEEKLRQASMLLLLSRWKVQNLEWVDPNGIPLLKINELSVSPLSAALSLKGNLVYYGSDPLTFKFNGLNDIQVQAAQKNVSLEEARVIIRGQSDKQLAAIQTLLHESETLPPYTLAAAFYKGMVHGYTDAMARHASNPVLDYVSRCAVVALTTEIESGSCRTVLEGEENDNIAGDATFYVHNYDFIVEATIPSVDIVKALVTRSTEMIQVTSKEQDKVQFIFKDQIDDSLLQKFGKQTPVPDTPPTAPNTFTDEEIKKYLQAHPEVIADYLKKHSSPNVTSTRKQAPSKEEPIHVAQVDHPIVNEIIQDKTNSVLGNPNGSFIIVEFFDYNCGYCNVMNKNLAKAIQQSDNIRWVLMDLPIFGERSEMIAKYALAAGKQGQFETFHQALENASDKSEKGLQTIGRDLGLDVEQLIKDAHSQSIQDKLMDNRKIAQKLNIGSGVPVFIINGEQISGAFPDSALKKYIRQAEAMKNQ